jgi:hypothetical protein
MKNFILYAIGAVCIVGLASAQTKQTRVIVEIEKVYCKNTEDNTGADEFYVVSALAERTTRQAKVSVKPPVSINDKQTKGYVVRLFDAVVPQNSTLRGGVRAFDEDVAKDWKKVEPQAKKAADALAAGLAAGGALAAQPELALAGGIIKLAFPVVSELIKLDEDDRLGNLEFNIDAKGAAFERKTWKFSEGGFVSNWDYTLTYTIRREVQP